MTLTGARSANSNGAGIRAEGINLTVERVRFLRNENGILHAGVRRGALIVRDSVFIGNGSCEQACAHGIYAGPLEVAACENSRFRASRGGSSRQVARLHDRDPRLPPSKTGLTAHPVI